MTLGLGYACDTGCHNAVRLGIRPSSPPPPIDPPAVEVKQRTNKSTRQSIRPCRPNAHPSSLESPVESASDWLIFGCCPCVVRVYLFCTPEEPINEPRRRGGCCLPPTTHTPLSNSSLVEATKGCSFSGLWQSRIGKGECLLIELYTYHTMMRSDRELISQQGDKSICGCQMVWRRCE